jgi:hypothetical protein
MQLFVFDILHASLSLSKNRASRITIIGIEPSVAWELDTGYRERRFGTVHKHCYGATPVSYAAP